MEVEVWSDVVCPWCFIGKRRLERALAEFPQEDQVRVRHRAFQLDPGAQTAGRPTVDVCSQRSTASTEVGHRDDERRHGHGGR